jgi:hypothetical protein
MPMKCIDQMPMPMDSAPALSHAQDLRGLAVVELTQPARSKAVYEAMIATSTESVTSFGSW